MKPTKFIEQFVRNLDCSDAIDIGCGNGRNASYLNSLGWDVTAVDIVTPPPLENIKIIQSSIITLELDTKYDLVLCLMTLHFMNSKNDVSTAISKLKNLTKNRGYVCVSVFTDKNPYGTRPYLFKEGELESYFKDWEIILSENQRADPIVDQGLTQAYWVNRLIIRSR